MSETDYLFLKHMFIKYFTNYRQYEIAYIKSLLGEDNTTGNSYLKLRTEEMDSDYMTFMNVLKVQLYGEEYLNTIFGDNNGSR